MTATSKRKILAALRWIATGTALLYAGVFVANFFSKHNGGPGISMEIEWGIPDNPRFVITLALVCGASAAWIFRKTGKVISTFVSIALIAFQTWQWFDSTTHIKINTGLSRFPGAGWIGNAFIGGGPFDGVALVSAVCLLLFTLGRLTIRNAHDGNYAPGDLMALSRR
jgi:hypothetical protein